VIATTKKKTKKKKHWEADVLPLHHKRLLELYD